MRTISMLTCLAATCLFVGIAGCDQAAVLEQIAGALPDLPTDLTTLTTELPTEETEGGTTPGSGAHIESDGQVVVEAENYTAMTSDSLEVRSDCRIEPSVEGSGAGTRYQFERNGYFHLI